MGQPFASLAHHFSVAGLIVYVAPDHLTTVITLLADMTGTEVHGHSQEGKVIVTIEELPGQKTMVNTITAINQFDGVLSTSLIYSHSEDESTQEMQDE